MHAPMYRTVCFMSRSKITRKGPLGKVQNTNYSYTYRLNVPRATVEIFTSSPQFFSTFSFAGAARIRLPPQLTTATTYESSDCPACGYTVVETSNTPCGSTGLCGSLLWGSGSGCQRRK